MVTKQQGPQGRKGTSGGGARPRKRGGRSVPAGIAYVKASFNNTLVTITDPSGNVIAWASAGRAKFSGSRKSSGFAASVAAESAAKGAMQQYGLNEVEVVLKGPGGGRESAVRGLQSAGLQITYIRDRTPVPHNGCRPRKRRRV